MKDMNGDKIKNNGVRVLAVAAALIVFLFTYVLYYEIAMAGFPDGHLTDYDRAVKLPFTICNWINVVFGLYLLYLGFIAKAERPGRKVLITVLLFILFNVITLYGMAYYYKDYLGLDHGQGG